MPLRTEGGLKVHAEHGGVRKAELDDPPDLVEIYVAFDRSDEDNAHVGLGEPVQRAELGLEKICTATKEIVRSLVKAVELEVDMRPKPSDPSEELVVASDTDPVRVHHHVRDPLALRQCDEVEKLRVQRRLASGELHDLRVALSRDEGIEHRIDLLVGELESCPGEVRPRVREAQRTVEIAGRVHLDEREAGVLLVLGAETAIERTTLFDLGLESKRQRSRLVMTEDARVEIGVSEHDRLERAVVGATFPHHHLAVAKMDLRVDHPATDRTERPRDLPEDRLALRARHERGHRKPDEQTTARNIETSSPTAMSAPMQPSPPIAIQGR